MEKDKNKSPSARYSDDVPEGLFISPLDDSESFRKMEAEEAKILSPPRAIPANSNSGDTFAPSAAQHNVEQEDATYLPPQKSVEATPEQLIFRFAGELKSIKQDLLSIKQHFEALKKPQPAAALQPVTSQTPPAQQAVSVIQPASASQADPDTIALLNDIKKLLLYLDRLLESLPEEKIEEFANSEYFSLYRNIFERLGLS